MRRLKRLAVIGVGLVGGSFALALRRAGAVASVAGYDRDAQALEHAAALGVIDTACASASEAAKGAELVVVAVPVRAIGPVLHDVALTIDPAAVVTDVGSTKGDVVRVAETELRERFPRFVPGHPIAGREASGVESAVPDLFRAARVVLTPTPSTAPDALELVKGCWEAVGGRIATMAASNTCRWSSCRSPGNGMSTVSGFTLRLMRSLNTVLSLCSGITCNVVTGRSRKSSSFTPSTFAAFFASART